MRMDWIKINKIVDESSDIKTFYLDMPEDFTWEEGAHTHMALKGFNEGEKPNRALIRHMSISTLPKEGKIGITTRIKELCSEFKSALRSLEVGDEVALFKTNSNVPLKREGKNVYLLSAGVGLATFRPLVLDYLDNPEGINHMHSLNIDTSKEFIFTDLFTPNVSKHFTTEFVGHRGEYYAMVKRLANDQDGLFYIVGSDEFIKENIKVLKEHGISTNQMLLDKRQGQLAEFFPEQHIA